MKTAILTGIQQQKYLRVPIVLLLLGGVGVRQKFVRGKRLLVPGR